MYVIEFILLILNLKCVRRHLNYFFFLQAVQQMPRLLCRNLSSKSSNDDGDESDIVHLDDSGFIKIPEYPVRPDEPLEQRRQRYI